LPSPDRKDQQHERDQPPLKFVEPEILSVLLPHPGEYKVAVDEGRHTGQLLGKPTQLRPQIALDMSLLCYSAA
jgi:hypothetical protein